MDGVTEELLDGEAVVRIGGIAAERVDSRFHPLCEKDELLFVGRGGGGGFKRDEIVLEQLEDGAVEGDHAFVVARLDDFRNRLDFAVGDEAAGQRRHAQDFEGRDAVHGVFFCDKPLGDNADEHEREILRDLRLLVFGEVVDDSLQRLVDVHRVHGGGDEMAGLGGVDGGLDGLQITHFAKKDDIRILADDVAEGGLEVVSVGADFTLVDDGLNVFMDEFDRIFDRDDMLVEMRVDVVEHGGERRRFAGPRCARDEYEAALFLRHFKDDIRNQQFLGVDGSRRDAADRHGDVAALVGEVEAEAAERGKADAEIEVLHLFETRCDAQRKVAFEEGSHVVVGQRRLLQLLDGARDAHGGATSDGEEEVGGFHGVH